MDSAAIFIVFGLVTSAGAPIIIKLFEIGFSLQALEKKALWNSKAFPKKIYDIETNTHWRRVVRGYYHDKARIDWQTWMFVIALLGLWAIWVMLASFSTPIRAVDVTPTVNLYGVSQVWIIVTACLWFIALLQRWHLWAKHAANIENCTA